MKTPTRQVLDIIALAIAIGSGQDKDGRLQRRLNAKLAVYQEPEPGTVVLGGTKHWKPNTRPYLP